MSVQDSRPDRGEAGGLSVFAEREPGKPLYEDVKAYFVGLDFSAPMGKNKEIQFHST